MARRLPTAATRTKWSGTTTPSSAASLRNGKPMRALGLGARQPDGQAELDGQVEVDVEELGLELERAHVAVEVADVEPPQDRPLDLRPQLAAGLVEVGVVPEVGEVRGKPPSPSSREGAWVIGPQR